MGTFDKFRRTMSNVSGRTGRRAKALDDLNDWAATVQSFLTSFDLYGANDLGSLLEKTGDAKFELVGISYNGRGLLNQVRQFRDTGAPDLMNDIIDGAESVRRYLISPKLQEPHLIRAVLNLRLNYEKYRSVLDQIEGEL